MKSLVFVLLLSVACLARADYEPDLAKFLKSHEGYSLAKGNDGADEPLATETYVRRTDTFTYHVYAREGEIIAYRIDIMIQTDDLDNAARAARTALAALFPGDHFEVSQSYGSWVSPGPNTAQMTYRIVDVALIQKADIAAKKIRQDKENVLAEKLKKQLQP